MIKQILFSLALASTAAQSMELTVLHNPDMLFHITEQICNVHNWDKEKINRNIQRFARTNKTLYEYYSREKTQQNIVRQIALQNKMSDSMTAYYFHYKVSKKINCLFNKVNFNTANTFTEDDLKDAWYLNSTITCCYEEGTRQATLLTSAIRTLQFKKAKQLITACIDCSSTRCEENPLALMANNRCFGEDYKQRIWFDIITFLLKNNLHPDSRVDENSPTLLHQAALWNDLPCTRLLLEYRADPYLTCKKYGNCNAFELERSEPKGWLAAMVDEVEISKK